MKKFLFILVTCLCLFGITDNVYAASGKLTLSSNVTSVPTKTKFNVYVKYTGPDLISLHVLVKASNASCSVPFESPKTFVREYTTTRFDATWVDMDGNNPIPNGSKLLTLACASTSAGTAKFIVSLVNDDASDVNEDDVLVKGSTLGVTITGATTQAVVKTTASTKKTTNKTTTKSTTKKTTTKTTVGTTTKSTTITTKRTTINSTAKTTKSTNKKTTTTEPITTNIAHINDDMKLDKLKVVGYDIDFEKNLTGYKIYVDDKIDEVYVIAEAVDKSKKVVNTGVVNIEGLSHFSVHVYNEKTDQTVSYTVKIMREKSSLAEVLYTKFYKPSVALASIILILIILSISLYKSGTFFKVEKLPTIASENVTYDGSKFVSNNMIDDDVIDDEELEDMLEDVGIQELEEGGEEKLVTVLMDMNKKNDD